MPVHLSTRRKFIKQTTMAGLVTVAAPQVALQPFLSIAAPKGKQNQLVILFQGDSITDGNRGRNNDPNHVMGHGYAFSIASRAGAYFPDKDLRFYNRGISGNTIPDLQTRWQPDTLDLKPDVLSILVGVNDVDVALKQKDANATQKYEEGYRTLLNQTRSRFPDCLLVLGEPFIAPVGRIKENWPDWKHEMEKKQQVVQQLSKEYQTVFVPLQQVFDQAASQAPASYWVWDGIHPTVAGHELIARAWMKQVSKKLRFLKKLL